MYIVAGAAWGGRLASLNTIDLILQAGLVVKLVLFLLAMFSIISWAIIIFKWRELRRADQDSEAFLEVYHEGSLDAAYEAARELRASPLASIFLDGYGELNRMAKYAGQPFPRALDDAKLHSLARHLAWSASRETQRLERGLPFLATTGSATPFIGLFGTVVGIINSFHGIGQAGMASLAVVAPGIAEALVATAAGLAAAIPATIFYNQFVGDLRRLGASIELFGGEFEADLRRFGGEASAPARAAGG
jgi:biopolymer transport protein TolQ